MTTADGEPRNRLHAGLQPATPPCDVCGGSTYEARCKIICRRCGYTRDCSDP